MADDGVIAEFQSITGCDVERAKFYLESANMQLDLAISSFYESDGMETSEPVPEEPQGVAAPAAAAAGGGALAALAAGRAGGLNVNMPGMEDDEDSDSDEDEGQAFYAGGSSSSGNVILGPGKKKNKDVVGKLFRKAREAGAEEVRPGEAGTSSGRSFFQGGGFRLGSENQPSVAIGGPAAPAPEEPQNFVLKMWQNGFSIDEGELREYNNPENREFLAAIMKGSIPPELVKEAKGGEVHVDMEDHRQEEYVKPKVSKKPFQGAGHVLGSIAPQVTVSTPAAGASDPAQAEAKAKAEAKVDESQPTTNIQVRLANGSRLIVKLNHSQTVGDLRAYICNARPEYGSATFSLQTTFPNKELTDNAQSIKDAGLLGAAVLQRLK